VRGQVRTCSHLRFRPRHWHTTSGCKFLDPKGLVVPSIDRLVEHHPRQALAIRRLYRRDPEFRAICDDYEAVETALARWQAPDQAEPERVVECRRMLVELEEEALAYLRTCGGT
jgi:hypothetical protein